MSFNSGITMQILSVLAALSATATLVLASPVPVTEQNAPVTPYYGTEKRATCTTTLKRKAWHVLTNAEKKAYLDAELCLMWKIPGKTGLAAAKSRFDDLIKTHQLQTSWVHNDGLFLPFHRLLMHAHETLLRNECGYTGAQPYWDEVHDAGKFTTSDIFDATYGFGGDGVGTGANKCIKTGPFANYTLHVGPGTANTDHCITRSISNQFSANSGKVNIDECLSKPSYATAWPCMEAKPHAGGHGGVGGEMVNPTSSPGDPLFYMHHSFLDKVWWDWQKRDFTKRLTEISGYETAVRPSTGWVNASMNSKLYMYDIVPNATIGELMDTRGDRLCFEYVDA